MKEIPGRMWGFALYKEAINSDPGVTGMDLLYLPPPLPPANTYNTTAVSKQAIHIDIFLGGGSSVSLRIASFYEQEGIPSQSDGWLLKIPLRGDVCPDGSACQGGLEVW